MDYKFFFQLQNDIVWITGRGGKQIFVCKACGKLGGCREVLAWGNFDFGSFTQFGRI